MSCEKLMRIVCSGRVVGSCRMSELKVRAWCTDGVRCGFGCVKSLAILFLVMPSLHGRCGERTAC